MVIGKGHLQNASRRLLVYLDTARGQHAVRGPTSAERAIDVMVYVTTVVIYGTCCGHCEV